MEPMVDFQLGAANIRMRFTVRDNGEQPSPGCRSTFRELLADDPFLLFPANPGIVYELFVNGKRFEDLTQALPSPVRIHHCHSPSIYYTTRYPPRTNSIRSLTHK